MAEADGPALMVVVDTEVEFDWSGALDRNAAGIDHLRSLHRLQDVCDAWGIRPVYVLDHPVASAALAAAVLRPWLRAGRAFVGAHLHPATTPPFLEPVTSRHSYPGNLPPGLEHAKLAGLQRRIGERLEVAPLIYKAGRYGLGPGSFSVLEDLGFLVDLSPAPPFDYRAQGGPDFSRRGCAPLWVGPRRHVLSIPGTGALVGRLPSPRLYRAAQAAGRLRAPALLARLGLTERLRLSPEGQDAADLARLVRALFRRNQRLFVLSLHSPSLEPGHTPYVRSLAERDQLLATLATFLRFFFTELGGRATDPLRLHATMRAAASEPVAADG